MKSTGLRQSDWLWKRGGGYYSESARDLALRPLLPDLRRIRDRRLFALFADYGGLGAGSRVLEIGCGRSAWLPCLAIRFGCVVTGIDIEPDAADLASANLAGAGVAGSVLCRDAFVLDPQDALEGRFDLVYSMGVMEHFDDAPGKLATLGRYLRPGGRIVTTVPNLRGLNWALQRFADAGLLQCHVIYSPARLRRAHEAAGFETLAAGVCGFCDGYLSSAVGARNGARRRIHGAVCRTIGRCVEAWTRLGGERLAPEAGWVAPHVFYAGRKPRAE